jgi:hypothetical protein
MALEMVGELIIGLVEFIIEIKDKTVSLILFVLIILLICGTIYYVDTHDSNSNKVKYEVHK